MIKTSYFKILRTNPIGTFLHLFVSATDYIDA